jgi:hypothetical protein
MEETTTQTAQKPSDVEVFLGVLPNLVGSFAAKHNDARSATDLAIDLARQTTGQLVLLGVCDQSTMCRDNRPLALVPGQPVADPSNIPSNIPTNPVGLGNGHSRQGAMVAQFRNENVTKIQGL